MKSFTCIIVILLLGFSSLIQAQTFYAHTPIGKETFELSDQLILLKFKKQIPAKAKQQLLANKPFIALPKDHSWEEAQLTILDLKGQPTAGQIQRMVERFTQHPHIEYASPFLTTEKGGYVAPSDRVIVGLKKASDRQLLDQQSEHFGLKSIVADTFLQNIFYLKVPASQSLAIANQLHESEQFEFAEVDFVSLVETDQTADPLLPLQWGLQNTQQGMNVLAAWEYTTGSPSVRVAILDSGVKLNHTDLKNSLLPGYDATSQAGWEDPGGAKNTDAHGTMCAGVVAAEANNGIGIAGVAFNTKIVPIRIAYDQREVVDAVTGRLRNEWTMQTSWAVNGINWAVSQGIDILSNSYSSTIASYYFESAVNNAALNGRNGKGALVFFSSDNKGEDEISAFARLERALAVGSITANNVRAATSSYGTGLDLTAPGVNIETTNIDGGFTRVNGTSFACPNAAAVMALILSVNPDLTYSEARFVLESTCDKPSAYAFTNNPVQPNGTWNSNVGHGVVNAERAVALACSMRGGCEPIETHCFNAEWIEGDGIYHANPSFGNGARQNSAAHSAWFRFRAPSDGEINIDACGSGSNTRLFVYTGACDNIADVANNDDGPGCGLSSAVRNVRVEAGRDYFIEWDSYHSSAPFLFRFDFKPLVSPYRIYVDGNRSSSGATTGTSWSTAIRDLQDALTLARSGETAEIWVADGTYRPSQAGDRTRSFELINGVSMYGGFQGWESQLSQRNLNASAAVLSGNIGSYFSALDNSYTVVSAVNVNSNTRLDGFAIASGRANSFPDAYQDWDTKRAGAGIYIEARGLGAVSEPTIENCKFNGNVADFGGAIAIRAWQKGNCQPRFINCSATLNKGQVAGAFLYVRSSFESHSTPYFENCTFNNNSTLKGGAYLQAVDGHCMPLFNRCIFRSNEAIHGGGAIYNFVDQGGNGQPTFTNCLFDRNTAPNGSSYGGAILNVAVDGVLRPRVLNCTFVDNYALHQGGAIFNHNVNSVALIEMTVINSIFYGNTTSAGDVMRAAGNRVFLDLRNNHIDRIDCNSTTAGTGTVRHCANMIFTTEDPFINMQGLDFSLKPTSLAVNAGSNEAILSVPQAQQDLLGSNRIEEDIVDIGALELVTQQGFEICDDFESYIPSNISSQATHWTRWSPQVPDAQVSNWRAATGQQSLHLRHQSNPTIKPDVLYNLGDQIRGHFSLGWRQYVSGNKQAYFNLQKFQNNPGEEYGFECYFLSSGRGRIKTGGRYDDFFYTSDNWLDIELHFDLERNWINFFIDDNLIYGWPLSNTNSSTNGTRQLGAINFYAITNADFYIDDICFSEAGDNLQSSLNQRASVPVPSQLLDYSQPKQLEEATVEVLPLQWKIFPNPTKDHVWIQSSINTDDPIQVAIFDATGKQLRYYQATDFNDQGFQMDLFGLMPGTYFVRLTHATGQETKSLVVIP